MVPIVASAATQVFTLNVPISVRNSPTKPDVPGKRKVCQGEHHESRSIKRHAIDQPAIGCDLARVHAIIDDSHAQEEGRGDEAM